MAHQKDWIERASPINIREYAALWGPGTGKTFAVIGVLRHKFALSKRVLKTFIFTLPNVIDGWVDQWLEHSYIDKKLLVPLKGPQKKRVETFLKYKDQPGVVFITNYEALLMQDLFKAVYTWGLEAVIWDESHKVKSIKAKTSKKAEELSNPKFGTKPLTYIATGSSIDNSPMDIFQQFLILDGGKTFGRNFFAFRARFFRDRNSLMPKDRYFPNWEIMSVEKDGIDGKAEIYRLISQKATVWETEDCVDLPEEIVIPVPISFSPEQLRLYKEMKDDLVTYYNSKACVGSLAIVKALRLMQIASGFVSVESAREGADNVEHILKSVPKIDWLRDKLTEIVESGHSVLIWAVFKQNYKMIAELCENLKIGYVELHGGISETQKALNQERFQNDPDCRVMIGHPASGGVGTNKLMKAKYTITYSRNFSLTDYKQSRARNRRQGSLSLHDKVVYYEPLTIGSIEKEILEALKNKQEISEQVLRGILG